MPEFRPICRLLVDFEDSEIGELEEVAIVLELPEVSSMDRDLSLDVFCRNLGSLDVDGDDGDWLPRSALLIVQWGRRRRQERGSRARRCGGVSEKALSQWPRVNFSLSLSHPDSPPYNYAIPLSSWPEQSLYLDYFKHISTL